MTSAATLPKVTAAELAEQLAAGSTTVLDVRTPGEYATASIEASQHLPLDQIPGQLDLLGNGLSGPVTLVCRSGQRAAQAYEQLSAAGARELTVLDGGITAWQAAGQPVQATDGPSTWEMDRQVRLAAGTLVLGGILASLRWPKARFLSGVVGGGLTFAALSNTCAMSRILLKLPYNQADKDATRKTVEALTGR